MQNFKSFFTFMVLFCCLAAVGQKPDEKAPSVVKADLDLQLKPEENAVENRSRDFNSVTDFSEIAWGQPKSEQESIESPQSVSSDYSSVHDTATFTTSMIPFSLCFFFALSGLFICVFGFKNLALLMVVFSFYVTYYDILFILCEFGLNKPFNLTFEVFVFLIAFLSSVTLAVLCYFYTKATALVFGAAIATAITLFYAQFFADFSELRHKLTVAVIYGAMLLVWSALAMWKFDSLVIVGAALIGAIVSPINAGVLFGYFPSFENRYRFPEEGFPRFWVFLAISLGMFCFAVIFDCCWRRRVVTDLTDVEKRDSMRTSWLI